MKKLILAILFVCTSLCSSEISELTSRMIDIHKNNFHVEKKLDKPYEIKGYAETKLNLIIENNKRYLFIKNIVDNKYVYILFEFKPGNNRNAFNKTRVKIMTKCDTKVSNTYYKNCL